MQVEQFEEKLPGNVREGINDSKFTRAFGILDLVNACSHGSFTFAMSKI